MKVSKKKIIRDLRDQITSLQAHNEAQREELTRLMCPIVQVELSLN